MKNITSAFHGLEAYSGKKGIHALVRAARAIDSITGEMCTSNILIGEIGVLVDAIHVAAFNRDVWSTTGTLGERTFHASKLWADEAIGFESEEGLNKEDLLEIVSKAKQYAEFFAKRPSVQAVVVKASANQVSVKRARVLARALKVPCLKVYKDSFKAYV